MMKSTLTVVTPATSQDLTLLANVKADLGITTTTEDANLEVWIDQASGVIADYCNRTFGSETDLETIRNRVRLGRGGLYGEYGNSFRFHEVDFVILRRTPITAFTSVVEDGITLVEGTDFECDYTTGILTRLNTEGFERGWRFANLLVTYTAGYELLGTLPQAIERAAITMVKYLRAAAANNPLLMSEVIPGVRSVEYAVGKFGGSDTWPPQDVMNLIYPYRQIDV